MTCIPVLTNYTTVRVLCRDALDSHQYYSVTRAMFQERRPLHDAFRCLGVCPVRRVMGMRVLSAGYTFSDLGLRTALQTLRACIIPLDQISLSIPAPGATRRVTATCNA